MTPATREILDRFRTALAACDAQAARNQFTITSTPVVAKDYFPPDLIADIAAVPYQETAFWLELLANSVMLWLVLGAQRYEEYYSKRYRSITKLFAPVRAAYTAQVQYCIAACQKSGNYDPFLQSYALRLYENDLRASHHLAPALEQLLRSLAAGLHTSDALMTALSLRCPFYGEHIFAFAPALSDPDTLAEALRHPVRVSYYGQPIPNLCADGLLALLSSNPNIKSSTRARLRDIFAMQYITHDMHAPNNLAALSALNTEVVADSHPVPDLIVDTLLLRLSTCSLYTGAIAASLGLSLPRVVNAHIARASTDRSFLPSLAHMTPLLSRSQWHDMVMSIVSARDSTVFELLEIAIANMPIGALSAIMPQFLGKVIPRALPTIAPIVATEDWALIIKFYKKRSHAAAQQSLLEFIEKTTSEVRALMPRTLLALAFKSADPTIRARAFAVLGILAPPVASATPTTSR